MISFLCVLKLNAHRWKWVVRFSHWIGFYLLSTCSGIWRSVLSIPTSHTWPDGRHVRSSRSNRAPWWCQWGSCSSIHRRNRSARLRLLLLRLLALETHRIRSWAVWTFCGAPAASAAASTWFAAVAVEWWKCSSLRQCRNNCEINAGANLWASKQVVESTAVRRIHCAASYFSLQSWDEIFFFRVLFHVSRPGFIFEILEGHYEAGCLFMLERVKNADKCVPPVYSFSLITGCAFASVWVR